MAGSEFVGFRLNYKHDKDILDALENSKDRTKEIKRLLRIAIQATTPQAVTTVEPIQETSPEPVHEVASAEIVEVEKVEEKNLPVENKVTDEEQERLKNNILFGFD